MLRIYQRRFSRSEAEERSIEHFDVVENRFRLDVIRVGKYFRGDTLCVQLFVAEELYRLDSVAQISPELFEVPGPGETSAAP